MITTLRLPERLRAWLCNEARAAFPRECCGLIEGTIRESFAQIVELHPAPNVATRDDRFEIDPDLHIALLRQLRGTDRSIIGCYHSHPNGRAEPSQHDAESAGEVDFLWVIAALEDSTADPRITAFVSTGNSFQRVGIEMR